MLQSMTGYGSAHDKVDGIEYAVEARSVNNRYLKITIKLPESCSPAEAEIEKCLRSKITRGTISLSIRMKVQDELAVYNVNTAAMNKYLEQLRELEIEANPLLRIDLGSLLQLPGVTQPPPLEEICQKTFDGLMKLVAMTVDDLVKMRGKEGKALLAELLLHCKSLEEGLKIVETRRPAVIKEYHSKLAQRVAELTSQGRINIDSDVLAREVAIFADRCDVAEEVSRLRGHIEQFRQATSAKESAGRKLDFIAQEMLREANTIASKSCDTEISKAVVDMKTTIDRIKEQVQNVE